MHVIISSISVRSVAFKKIGGESISHAQLEILQYA